VSVLHSCVFYNKFLNKLGCCYHCGIFRNGHCIRGVSAIFCAFLIVEFVSRLWFQLHTPVTALFIFGVAAVVCVILASCRVFACF